METDAQFLLRVLSDGRPHSLNEILQASFAERGCGLTVHSRASDLRSQGHIIVHETVKGAERGAGHTYRLVQPTPGSQEWIDKHMAVAHELAIKSANSVLTAEPVYACVVDESAGQAEQLALTDSAAAHIYRDMARTPL
jgi:hypothetical protein